MQLQSHLAPVVFAPHLTHIPQLLVRLGAGVRNGSSRRGGQGLAPTPISQLNLTPIGTQISVFLMVISYCLLHTLQILAIIINLCRIVAQPISAKPQM